MSMDDPTPEQVRAIEEGIAVLPGTMRRWMDEGPFEAISGTMRSADGSVVFTLTRADGRLVADLDDGQIIDMGTGA
jgi:hypothetical protein